MPDVADSVTIWEGCYDKSWKDLIQDKSVAHPAKYANGLITRIFKHGLERGWWSVGDLVGDCFGGIGTGGVVAAGLGLRWVGVELEPRFVRMAAGYDCPGMSKGEWVRWFGRYVRHADLCPQCQLGFGRKDVRPLLPDGDGQYYGDGRIPWVAAHRYAGNGVRMVQGDSRQFASIVGALDCVVTSPPYAETSIIGGDQINRDNIGKGMDLTGHHKNAASKNYGTTPGQIGSLKAGKLELGEDDA